MEQEQEQKRASESSKSDTDSVGEGPMLYGGNIAAACAATNAVTRPQDNLTEEEIRKKRLQMNRANAQRNRDRKRIMMDMLQNEKNELSTKNKLLKSQNEKLRSAINNLKAQRKDGSAGDAKNLLPASKKRKIETPVRVGERTVVPVPQLLAATPQSNIARETFVSAMARDLLVQEQLLAQRLSQASQAPTLLNLGMGLGNPLLNSQRRPGESPLSFLSSFIPQNHQALNHTLLSNQGNFLNLSVEGAHARNLRTMNLLGLPTSQQDIYVEVPARTALLSSITTREPNGTISALASPRPEQKEGQDEDERHERKLSKRS